MLPVRRRKEQRADQYESDSFKEIKLRLARSVRRLRDDKQWTQEDAAHYCNMSVRLLQRIESASVNATLTTIARLSAGFDVDVAGLFDKGDGSRQRA